MLQILALFDDTVALSQIENILLNNPDFCDLFNMEQIQTPPKMENCKEIKKNKEHRNNGTNATANQDKENGVFAIPKVYYCMYCDKHFYNQTAIRRHQLNHAKKQLRCPKCRVNSYTFGTLRRHYLYNHDVNRKPPIGLLDTMHD
jgi:DNA-directed RNA polymerase subunit RPC12/RpoP